MRKDLIIKDDNGCDIPCHIEAYFEFKGNYYIVYQCENREESLVSKYDSSNGCLKTLSEEEFDEVSKHIENEVFGGDILW